MREEAGGRSKGALRDFKTGTGGAYAPLSEILPATRVARSVRMTEGARVALLRHEDDTPARVARG